jgi:hypothetical protein
MEDAPVENTVEDKDDKKDRRKRRTPSFLSTWLRREAETPQETEEPKKPFSERAYEIFQKFFSREAERPEEIEEETTPEESEPQQFFEFSPPKGSELASAAEREAPPDTPEVPEPTAQPEAEPAPPANEGGELIIDHEEEEAAETVTPETPPEAELPPLVEPPIAAIQREVEMAGADRSDGFETPAPVSQPEKIGDVLDRRLKQDERNFIREKQRNRRRNRQLKKQVRELKHEDREQVQQQETLKKEQTELQSQVEQLRRQPDVSKLIERQEKERAELRASRGLPGPETAPHERPQPAARAEAVRPQPQEARTPIFETPRPTPRPVELARPQYEVPAAEDTRSEREFERRHEIKDEAGSPTTAGYAALASADAAYRAAAAQLGQAAATQNVPAPQPMPPASKPAFQPSDIVDSPMYRQAVRTGFLTAVILLAIWLVIYIAR